MSAYTHIHESVQMYVCMNVCMHMFMCSQTCMSICLHVNMYVYMCCGNKYTPFLSSFNILVGKPIITQL